MACPSDAELREIKAFQRGRGADGWLPAPGGRAHPDNPGTVLSGTGRPGLGSEAG